MIKLLRYLIYLLLASLILGPLGAVPLGIPQINIYFTDIIVGLIGLIWLINIRQTIRLIQSDPIAKYFLVFAGIATISLIFSPLNLALNERIISGLYIVRLIAYFSIYLTARYLTDSSTIGGIRASRAQLATPEVILSLLSIIGLILAGLGWLQYFLYPDLRNLYYLGWDPHFARIFSTYLDPNYFGLMMVLTFILLFEFIENYYLKASRLSRRYVGIARRIISLSLTAFIFLTLMFTYSRSSFLAFFAAIVYLSIKVKRIKIIMVIIIILALSMILLPRPGGAGVRLERVFSIETRIENWQQAFKIFADHPILGIGFNTVRYAKNLYNFGQDNLSESHAGAGFDNSFLFVASTTGFLGLATYLLFLRQVFRRGNLLVRMSLIAVIIHSFFLNSLFFPWVMLWMWVVLATGPAETDKSS